MVPEVFVSQSMLSESRMGRKYWMHSRERLRREPKSIASQKARELSKQVSDVKAADAKSPSAK